MNDFFEFGKAELKGWSEPETAAAYADGFASAAVQCVPDMVKASGADNESKTLDVCCGQGIVAQGLSATGASVIGLDFSPAMLELSRARVPGIEFIEGDATSLPFENQSFNAVTMGFGILHIPNSEAAIREAYRVLKPRGKFVYSVWHSPKLSAAFRIVFSAIGMLGSKDVSLPSAPDIHAYADPDIAYPALEAAGFSDTKIETSDSYWEVDDPAKPYDYFFEGTVRGALLLRSQPKKNAEAIRSAIGEAVKEEFGSHGPWKIPIPAAIVSAVRQ